MRFSRKNIGYIALHWQSCSTLLLLLFLIFALSWPNYTTDQANTGEETQNLFTLILHLYIYIFLVYVFHRSSYMAKKGVIQFENLHLTLCPCKLLARLKCKREFLLNNWICAINFSDIYIYACMAWLIFYDYYPRLFGIYIYILMNFSLYNFIYYFYMQLASPRHSQLIITPLIPRLDGSWSSISRNLQDPFT